jgi:hypothetical protein
MAPTMFFTILSSTLLLITEFMLGPEIANGSIVTCTVLHSRVQFWFKEYINLDLKSNHL